MRTKWVGNTKVSYERSNRKSKKMDDPNTTRKNCTLG